MSDHKGSCLCGKVRFTAREIHGEHHVCHCGMCQKWAGGPVFAAMADGVSFEGGDFIKTYSSSEWAERGFCSNCGSNLYYRLKDSGQYIMATGLFDDKSVFKVVGEIFIDRKPPGYDIAGDHPRLTEAETFEMFAKQQQSTE
ncbi:MAG: GFA family protein [Geminicoccaceae bacterium]|nr:GFA family protein [Geminicoccaceae bacterium]